jgi:NAD(P)-dependent dehydrogenase (short-subunit alcohol dehydrogenase family)
MKRKWLITGVSSGLGRSLMEAVARHGDDVAGTVRTLPDAEPNLGPGRVKLFRMDVTDGAAIGPAVAAAADWLGGIDVVVNNAGSGVFGPVEVCDVADYARAMEVNFFGPLAVTKAALPYLRESKGMLFNVASMAAFIAMGGTSAYTASKHALLGASEALREELAPLGVRVVVPMPGGFRTNFWSEQSNTIREGLDEVYGGHASGQIRTRSQQHVGNEFGDPRKYAELLIRLAEADPPLFLVVGRDALDYIEAKRSAMLAELESQRLVAEATAF